MWEMASLAVEVILAFLFETSIAIFYIFLPKKTVKTADGRIPTKRVLASMGEMNNTIISVPIMVISALARIDTFVLIVS